MGVAYTDPMFSKQAEVAIADEDFEDFPQVEVATSTGELNHLSQLIDWWSEDLRKIP